MPQHTGVEIENDVKIVKQPNETFLFKEPIVLLTIICLSASKGMTIAVQDLWSKGSIPISLMYQVRSLSGTAVPMLGIIFFAFLSEIHGRKPTFIVLYSLSIVSCILNTFPWQESVTYSFPVQGVVNGGSLVMTTLAITEYCSPKHRFTYLLANSIVLHAAYSLTSIVFNLEARSYPYVQSFQIVLGLVCLVSACKWPESPYWLACIGKLEDSREAFLWLRGEESRKELLSVTEGRRFHGSIKLYRISLSVAVATISVAMFTNIGSRFWQRWRVESSQKDVMIENAVRLCSSIVVAFLVSVVSYFVRRKVLFLLVTGVSVVLSYGIAIWMYVDEAPSNQLFYFVFFTSDIIGRYGPTILGIVLCIEIIPLKYNTHMACVMLLFNYIVHFILFLTLIWGPFKDFESSRIYLPIFVTLSLGGVVVYYCYAPETKDKTLLEIQKLYMPELSDANSKEDNEIMTHM